MNNEDNQLPVWFVFDEQGGLNIEKTLCAVPEKLDKTVCFFREVPTTFEFHFQDETKDILNNIDSMPKLEREKHSDAEIEEMRCAFEKLLRCQNIALREDLTPAQKEFMRCLCYWVSLETMEAIPLTPEDEKNLFA